MPPSHKRKFIIIDSNALIHRAFHALPPLINQDGQMTNAVYGFTTILLKTIKDIKPDYLVATFDRKEKTFRHQEYDLYKATREKAPDELYQQIPVVKEVLEAFNVPIFELAGYEADDLIGTICHLKSVDNKEVDSIIVTGDQDTLQLVDENTKVLSPHKGLSETILYDEKSVEEKYEGLKPDQLIDYKALRGDQSDNIPGVKGIGHKGAINLLKDFKTLENLYQNLDDKKIKDRTRELLITYKADAILSKKLATILTDAPIDFDLSRCAFIGFDRRQVIELFQRLNFKRLLGQLNTMDGKLSLNGQSSLFDSQISGSEKKSTDQKYELIKDEKALEKFLQQLKKQKEFCFDTETTSEKPFQAELLGISFSWHQNEGYYLPTDTVNQAKPELIKIFADANIKKIGHNLKYDIEILSQNGFEIKGAYFDTMIASYILNADTRQHNLDTLAFVELGYQMQSIKELIGEGKNKITMADVPVEKVSWYSCEDADLTWRLYQKLSPELDKEGMRKLMDDIDMPLVEVLAEIEKNGVKIDANLLAKLAVKLTKKIKSLEGRAYKLAGTEFNLASPKQLKEVLFEKLKISTQGLSRTKTGVSTAASELEKMAGQHKIIDLIIEFRELSKLKNTYLDALPKLINPKTGRVHTSFNQTVTATGRLSSSDPNLQNIPIRTEMGNEIRKAFVAEAGFKILKADYSQIELRIVASLANDEKMLTAFDNQVDIHTQTAAAINEIKTNEVTPEIRRQAKEVNFGVLYGMGAWGLAQRTGIGNQKAKEFIDKYFEVFQGVRNYIDQTIEIASDKGYVETFYGRRRYLPELNSGVNQVKKAAERMAINMPIQGTAADLLKLAMRKIYNDLPAVSPKTKMILQVHDELVFEVPEKDIKKVAQFITQKMNEIYSLRAPIETEVSVGDNWGETKAML